MLRLQDISKSFAGVKALTDVSLEFAPSEVHAICGENGAGKSTLMNIVMGNLQPDTGQIYWNTRPVKIDNALAAQKLGIFIVYQESSLADSLSIAENIFPFNMPLTSAGLISYPLLYAKTENLLTDLGLGYLSPKTEVGRLSVAHKQMVQIAKATAHAPSLLILDEPTASLTHHETAVLFRIIAQLKSKGAAIIYISHRMHEIREIADKISILKDGKFSGSLAPTASSEEIIRMMVGRELEKVSYQSHNQPQVQLELINLSGKGFSDISLRVYKGEVIGFAGLQGSGRTELVKALFGDRPFKSGKLKIAGESVKFRHPAGAMRAKVAYLPEDRKAEGLFAGHSVAENIFAARLSKGIYSERSIRHKSKILCEQFGVRCSGVKQAIRNLSGGNQQKVMLLRSLVTDPEILIINEPTQGVDAGARAEIYKLLKDLTSQGKSILLSSGDLTELLCLADRIVVMHEGKVSGILSKKQATEEKITTLASGIAI